MPRPSSFNATDDNLGQRHSGTPTFPRPPINRPGTRGDQPLSRNV